MTDSPTLDDWAQWMPRLLVMTPEEAECRFWWHMAEQNHRQFDEWPSTRSVLFAAAMPGWRDSIRIVDLP